MSLGNTQTSEGGTIYPECLENNYILLGYGEDIDFSQCHNASLVKQRFIEAGYEIKPQDYNVTSVNTFVNKMREGDLVVISDGNHRFKAIAEVTSGYSVLEGDCDRDGYLQKREVRWLLTFDTPRPVDELCHTVFSQMTLYNLKDSVISREKLSALLNQKEETLEEVLNHVLVIDEINRGNISKIFGELITLIEPSKRQGADEALALTLPHSQQPFSVPDNLFIIGTMNTADRSLAMMDTALRRRFEFVEMMPQPALLAGCVVNGIDVQRLLKTMNDRIEILYDREHTLGHAFFMPVKALMDDDKPERAFAALISVFQNKIIPLLEEYFLKTGIKFAWY
ncbi:McrBC restriction endonuclease system McrB subunit putative [Photobacterium aphoticum]|uniref:McrBC restriction endonuclease system McrB subunit putative n=1 Tax=Photobacterium aphoticum TaxID=754436 RepID=A0A090QM75_9GAMM|nr:McrBC restriction endonuclease system McrB subunit putative [Photobacterium aphoticum]